MTSTYAILLKITTNGDEDHPRQWDWHDMLDLGVGEDVEVLMVSPDCTWCAANGDDDKCSICGRCVACCGDEGKCTGGALRNERDQAARSL